METVPSAELIEFPNKFSCENCSNVLFGSYGAYCREFHEDLHDLDVAQDCPAFDYE